MGGWQHKSIEPFDFTGEVNGLTSHLIFHRGARRNLAHGVVEASGYDTGRPWAIPNNDETNTNYVEAGVRSAKKGGSI